MNCNQTLKTALKQDGSLNQELFNIPSFCNIRFRFKNLGTDEAFLRQLADQKRPLTQYMYAHEHPAFDIMLTEKVESDILSEVNRRKSETGNTLRTADLFHIWKPYFEWMHSIDPHIMDFTRLILLNTRGTEG